MIISAKQLKNNLYSSGWFFVLLPWAINWVGSHLTIVMKIFMSSPLATWLSRGIIWHPFTSIKTICQTHPILLVGFRFLQRIWRKPGFSPADFRFFRKPYYRTALSCFQPFVRRANCLIQYFDFASHISAFPDIGMGNHGHRYEFFHPFGTLFLCALISKWF